MFRYITAANRDRHAALLADMHRLRAVMFGNRPQGGPEGAAVGYGERDSFDDELAAYLIRIDRDGEIACCARVRPTAAGSLMTTHLPAAIGAQADPVDGPRTWEFSHFYLRDPESTPQGQRMRAEMRLARTAAALDAGVRRIVAVVELDRWPSIQANGWNIRALGPAFTYAHDGQAIAFESTVTLADLAVFRRKLDNAIRNMAPELGDLIAMVGRLDPQALGLINSLSNRIAQLEVSEGPDVALALAEGLERALRGVKLD